VRISEFAQAFSLHGELRELAGWQPSNIIHTDLSLGFRLRRLSQVGSGVRLAEALECKPTTLEQPHSPCWLRTPSSTLHTT